MQDITPNPTPTSTKPSQASSIKKINLSKYLRYWPGLVVLVILALLGGIYFYAVSQFESNVTVDHAEHGRTSPSVHEIVHVRQSLLVGVNPDYQPLSYKVDGELVGFEIDLAKAIASELNVPVKFVEHDFRDSFSDDNLSNSNPLTEDKVDIVMAALAVTRSRSEVFSFSKSYLDSGQVAVTWAANNDIKTLEDLSGKKVAVESNTLGQQLIKSFGKASEVLTYATPDQAISAVSSGQADAFIADATNAKALLGPHPDLHIATELLTHESYGIAVMRNESDLVNEIDHIIETLRQRGVLESLRQKWLE